MAHGPPAYSPAATNSIKARMGDGTATFVVSAGLVVDASAAAHLVDVIVRYRAATSVAVATDLKVAVAADLFAGHVHRGSATGVVLALDSNLTAAADVAGNVAVRETKATPCIKCFFLKDVLVVTADVLIGVVWVRTTTGIEGAFDKYTAVAAYVYPGVVCLGTATLVVDGRVSTLSIATQIPRIVASACCNTQRISVLLFRPFMDNLQDTFSRLH